MNEEYDFSQIDPSIIAQWDQEIASKQNPQQFEAQIPQQQATDPQQQYDFSQIDPNIIAQWDQEIASKQNPQQVEAPLVVSQSFQQNKQDVTANKEQRLGNAINKLSQTENIGAFLEQMNPQDRFLIMKQAKISSKKEGGLGFWTNVYQAIANASQSINQGVEQLGGMALSPFDDGKKFEEQRKKANQSKLIKELHDNLDPSLTRDVVDVGAQILAGAVIPGAASLTLPRAIASGVASGVAFNPATNKDNILVEKGLQGLTAGVGGGVGYGLGKGANALAKKMFGKNTVAELTPKQIEAIERAEKEGYETFMGNYLPKEAGKVQKIQNRIDENINTRSLLDRNTDKAYKDITEEASNYASKANSELGIDTSKLSAARKANADAISKKLTSEDPEEVLKGAFEKSYLEKQIKSDELYDKLDKLEIPKTFIPVNSFKKSLDELKNKRDSIGTEELKDDFNSLTNGTIKFLDYFDNVKSTKVEIKEIDNRIKEVGEMVRKARLDKNNTAELYLNKVREALIKDKDAFLSNSNDPKLKEYVKLNAEAKKYNADNIQNIKNNEAFRKLFLTTDSKGNEYTSQGILSTLNKNFPVAKKAYDQLDDGGKNQIKSVMLSKMIKDSTNADGVFQPKKFASNFKKSKLDNEYNFNAYMFKENGQRLNNLLKIYNNMKYEGKHLDNAFRGEKSFEVTDMVSLGKKMLAGKSLHNYEIGKLDKALSDPRFYKQLNKMLDINVKNKDGAVKFQRELNVLNSIYASIGARAGEKIGEQ